MPKYLILKHYQGGPEAPGFAPMSEWTPEECEAHFQYQRDTCQMLIDSGEFVGAEGLAPTGNWVQYGGEGKPPHVLDGPFPETKELIAGWFMIDVASEARAHEIAAYVSKAPGKGGEPIFEWLEVRPIMSGPPSTE
ncbi:MAG TPA: YciI family protein [Mycobacteriales bacterium]|nr:YciI family protein [Mycobacteriales bacterium]